MINKEKDNIYNAIHNLYNGDKTTWEEVLGNLYNIIADMQQKNNNLNERFELLLNNQFEELTKVLINDGTLETIIKNTVFSSLYLKIDKLENKINEIDERLKRLESQS